MSPHIHWSPNWTESIDPDEAARFAALAENMCAVARASAGRTGEPVGRVFHLKRHTGVSGVVRVLPDLPEPLASGVFARAAEIPCYVRFSNGAVRRLPDGIPDVRGFALKLVGVDGAQLLDEHRADRTQDFLFVQTPVVPTPSFDEFLELARAGVGGPLFLPLKLALHVGLPAMLRILLKLAEVAQPRSLAATTYFTAVPIRFGRAAAKLSLAPGVDDDERHGGDYRADLVHRLKRGPLSWRLRAQLYTDDRRTPIEDPTVEWQSPFHDVAVLELPRQDVEGARGAEIDALVDALAFTPWHGIAEHRPLGATQRARVEAYRRSSAQRGARGEPVTVLAPSP